MGVRAFLFGYLGVLFVSACAAAYEEPAPGCVPEPGIDELITQARQPDKVLAQKALSQLIAAGASAERALTWHLFKETARNEQIRYAELLAECSRGQVGYRVILELRPDGSGTLTLWSNRAALADCAKRYDRLQGQPEPVFTEEAMRHNPYTKSALEVHMPDGMKHLGSDVPPTTREGRIEATGQLSFKNFDSLSAFGEKFDPDGYHLLNVLSLLDKNATRTFCFRKPRENNYDRYQYNLLHFFDLKWQLVIRFNDALSGGNNAQQTENGKLTWTFNCHQMLMGEALAKMSYANDNLPPRPQQTADDAIAVPAVAQASQPSAIVKQSEIHAKTAPPLEPGQKRIPKELREKHQLVELDGRGSLPQNSGLQYQWVQTYGADMNLTSEALAKPYIPLIVRDAGEYRFELTVSQNGNYSKPAEVRVFVTRDEPSPPVAIPAAAAGQPDAHTAEHPPASTPAPEASVKTAAQNPGPAFGTPKNTVPPPAAPVASVSPTAPAAASLPPPVPSPPSRQPEPKAARELYLQGVQLFKSGELAKAKQMLSEANALNPEDMECLYDYALALMESGEFRAAASKFEDAANQTKRPEAFMNAGHCYHRMGSVSEARLWYQRGERLGKESVAWQSTWQLGNLRLSKKDYASALTFLTDAENRANKAGVKDFRLLRDTAVALHNSQKDAEALKRLIALQELGYTPDAALLAEVKAAAGGAAAAAAGNPGSGAGETPKNPAAAAGTKDAGGTAQAKAVTPPPHGTGTTPVAPAVKAASSEPVKTAARDTGHAPKTGTVPVSTAYSGTDAKRETGKTASDEPGKEPKKLPKEFKPRIRKPLPPVPVQFAAALAQGKRALQLGAAAQQQGTEEAKDRAAQYFDEAEAMLRGAWLAKNGDEEVLAAFKELANYIGAIALVRTPVVHAKTSGLVVLDGEPSIQPPEKPLYCVWEQIEGEDVGVRPEKMAQKKVALRIRRPGLYKFEFAVSDGLRGGTPVTVTVEVGE